MPQRPVGVTVYRPFDHEVPWNLLDADCQEATAPNLEFVRVAKTDEQVLGVYRLARLDATSFELVHLMVAPADRGRGIGWWLACHGLGLAEAKGGRCVKVSFAKAEASASIGFFAQLDFVRAGNYLQLALTPE